VEDRTDAQLRRPIGEVVRRWREHRGLSVTQLAERAGLSKGYISEVEHGRIARPRDAQLAKLAAALELSIWDLTTRRYPTRSARRRGARQGTRDTATDEAASTAAVMTELRTVLERATQLAVELNDRLAHPDDA